MRPATHQGLEAPCPLRAQHLVTKYPPGATRARESASRTTAGARPEEDGAGGRGCITPTRPPRGQHGPPVGSHCGVTLGGPVPTLAWSFWGPHPSPLSAGPLRGQNGPQDHTATTPLRCFLSKGHEGLSPVQPPRSRACGHEQRPPLRAERGKRVPPMHHTHTGGPHPSTHPAPTPCGHSRALTWKSSSSHGRGWLRPRPFPPTLGSPGAEAPALHPQSGRRVPTRPPPRGTGHGRAS